MDEEEPAWRAELRKELHVALRAYGEGDIGPGAGSDYGDQAAIALAIAGPHILAAEELGRRQAADSLYSSHIGDCCDECDAAIGLAVRHIRDGES